MGCTTSLPHPGPPPLRPPTSLPLVVASKPTKAALRPKRESIPPPSPPPPRTSVSPPARPHSVVPLPTPAVPLPPGADPPPPDPDPPTRLRPSSFQQQGDTAPPAPSTPKGGGTPRTRAPSLTSTLPPLPPSPSGRGSLPPLKTLPPLKMKGGKGGRVGPLTIDPHPPSSESPPSPHTPPSPCTPRTPHTPHTPSTPSQRKGLSRASPLPSLPPAKPTRLTPLAPLFPPNHPPLPPEYLRQLEEAPTLWSSPILIGYYPEVVFSHYAAMGGGEAGLIGRKGITRLSKDSVDEWVKGWKAQRVEGGEGKRGKAAGLSALSKVLGMEKSKEVTREEVVEWVMKRVRQEMKADGEGRVSRENFIGEWKACHGRVFGVVEVKEAVDDMGNPLNCAVM